VRRRSLCRGSAHAGAHTHHATGYADAHGYSHPDAHGYSYRHPDANAHGDADAAAGTFRG